MFDPTYLHQYATDQLADKHRAASDYRLARSLTRARAGTRTRTQAAVAGAAARETRHSAAGRWREPAAVV